MQPLSKWHYYLCRYHIKLQLLKEAFNFIKDGQNGRDDLQMQLAIYFPIV
jgi:hypothetical protein